MTPPIYTALDVYRLRCSVHARATDHYCSDLLGPTSSDVSEMLSPPFSQIPPLCVLIVTHRSAFPGRGQSIVFTPTVITPSSG